MLYIYWNEIYKSHRKVDFLKSFLEISKCPYQDWWSWRIFNRGSGSGGSGGEFFFFINTKYKRPNNSLNLKIYLQLNFSDIVFECLIYINVNMHTCSNLPSLQERKKLVFHFRVNFVSFKSSFLKNGLISLLIWTKNSQIITGKSNSHHMELNFKNTTEEILSHFKISRCVILFSHKLIHKVEKAFENLVRQYLKLV